jgi:hypothetical protein
MRTFIVAIVLAITAAPALAWDGPDLWYAEATADSPGGGGIIGTGGGHDYGVKCSHCHVERPTTSLAFGMQFSPALLGTTNDPIYAPGQRYTITASMTNATLGTSCPDPYGKNVDNFAAAFEDVNGAAVGVLESDTGGIATSCPQTVPMPDDPGTTAITKDCKVVFSKGTENVQTYTFYWTAPTTGDVNIFWGAVDGDCLMMSMEDAVVEGTMVLRAPVMPAIRWAFDTAASADLLVQLARGVITLGTAGLIG